jgi:hypothetical protein
MHIYISSVISGNACDNSDVVLNLISWSLHKLVHFYLTNLFRVIQMHIYKSKVSLVEMLVATVMLRLTWFLGAYIS